MKIIDVHTHIYPDNIAEKAASAIGKFYGIPMNYDGTLRALLEEGGSAGITSYVIHSVATTAAQVEPINQFIIDLTHKYPGKLMGFASMHPDYAHIDREIDRIMDMGLKGVKLHPDFQEFYIDDPRAQAIYESIEGRLPVLIHMGDKNRSFSKASLMAAMVAKYPKLQVICAHMGSYSAWDEAARELAGTGVYVDTSSSLSFIGPKKARSLIDLYGVDHVLFGTDYPMWDASQELSIMAQIPLTPQEADLIYHGNAERLLKL